MVKIFGYKLKKQTFILLLAAAISIVLLPFAIYVAQTRQEIRNRAVEYFSFTADPATQFNIYFDPVDIVLNQETTVSVMANFGGDVAFARVVFKFDPTKVLLTSDINTAPELSTTIEKTDMATANASGRAVFVIAAGPSDTLPTGNFELANFNIAAASSSVTGTATVEFDTADMQILALAGTQYTLTPGAANITFDQTQITPAPTDIAVPTLSPLPTITGGNVPTDIPQATPDPNVTVDPQPTDGSNPPGSGNQDDDDDGNETDDDDKNKQPDKDGDGGNNDNDDDKKNGKDDDKDDDKDNGTKGLSSIIKKRIGDLNSDGKYNMKDFREWILAKFRFRFGRK